MHRNSNRSPRLVLHLGVIATAAFCPPAALAQNWLGQTPPASPVQTLPPPQADIGDLQIRIDRLEEVVRRLNGEVERLRRRLGEGAEASTPPTPRPEVPQPPTRISNELQPQTLMEEGARLPKPARAAGPPTSLLPLPSPDVVSATSASTPAQAVGSTAPNSAVENVPVPGRSPLLRGPQASDQVEVAALPPASADTQAQGAYSQAYGRLIAEDLDGAEAAFSDFLKRFPSHELAGNAQYWLAESHFVRGQFASAAREFLTGSRTYASSPKAPESLLKLGLSLTALGRMDEACSSLREVAVRFPQAPSAVHERAAREQINAGC